MTALWTLEALRQDWAGKGRRGCPGLPSCSAGLTAVTPAHLPGAHGADPGQALGTGSHLGDRQVGVLQPRHRPGLSGQPSVPQLPPCRSAWFPFAQESQGGAFFLPSFFILPGSLGPAPRGPPEVVAEGGPPWGLQGSLGCIEVLMLQSRSGAGARSSEMGVVPWLLAPPPAPPLSFPPPAHPPPPGAFPMLPAASLLLEIPGDFRLLALWAVVPRHSCPSPSCPYQVSALARG